MNDQETPVLRIVNPDTTAEEVAAIVAVLAASGTSSTPAPRRRSEWAAYHRFITPVGHHGRGAWKASGLPR